ncbi:MAG: hypothetical protein ACQET5_04015 [Halobacteriota archaeon]|uniref:hypothetical protein n=1 Tax=Natronomonas sp. TaxID=2184060 RepID=UPI003974CEA1
MASSAPTNDSGTAAPSPALSALISAAAFWLAVLLPFCSLALLATGIDTTDRSLLFVGLVVGNVVALIVGHGYGR